jgi:predicted nucleic acid-binding protein
VSVLVDTNVLLRQFEPEHAHHRSAVDSVTRLLLIGEPVHVTAQNIAEFWAAATRSLAQNGLGLAIAVVAAALDQIERVFALLPDEPAIHAVWKWLVTTHGVIGSRVYDARLVRLLSLTNCELLCYLSMLRSVGTEGRARRYDRGQERGTRLMGRAVCPLQLEGEMPLQICCRRNSCQLLAQPFVAS